MNLKNGLLAGAFTLLAVVAAVGWTRDTPPSNPGVNYAQPADYNSNANPAACPQAGVSYQTAEYQEPRDGYVSTIHRPVVVRQADLRNAPPSSPIHEKVGGDRCR